MRVGAAHTRSTGWTPQVWHWPSRRTGPRRSAPLRASEGPAFGPAGTSGASEAGGTTAGMEHLERARGASERCEALTSEAAAALDRAAAGLPRGARGGNGGPAKPSWASACSSSASNQALATLHPLPDLAVLPPSAPGAGGDSVRVTSWLRTTDTADKGNGAGRGSLRQAFAWLELAGPGASSTEKELRARVKELEREVARLLALRKTQEPPTQQQRHRGHAQVWYSTTFPLPFQRSPTKSAVIAVIRRR